MHSLVPLFGGTSQVALLVKESACQCRQHKRHRLDPWVGKMLWRRAWQPTAALLPGESHGQRSLAGYSPRGLRESDTTEVTERTHTGYLPPECLLGEVSVQIFCLSISSSPYGPETLTPTSFSLHPHPWGLPSLYTSPVIITDSF